MKFSADQIQPSRRKRASRESRSTAPRNTSDKTAVASAKAGHADVAKTGAKTIDVVAIKKQAAETPEPKKVMTAKEIIGWRGLVRELVVAPHVKDYAIRLVLATHPRGATRSPSAIHARSAAATGDTACTKRTRATEV